MGVVCFRFPHRICAFDINVVGTDTASFYGRHRHKILSEKYWRQKGKYIEACLERWFHFVLLVLSVDGVMGGGRQRQQLRNWFIPCWKFLTCNIRQHSGMFRPVSTWTWLWFPLDFWCGVHGVASPGYQDLCQQTEHRHEEWRRREFKELDMERRWRVWIIWGVLGRDRDGVFILGDIS